MPTPETRTGFQPASRYQCQQTVANLIIDPVANVARREGINLLSGRSFSEMSMEAARDLFTAIRFEAIGMVKLLDDDLPDMINSARFPPEDRRAASRLKEAIEEAMAAQVRPDRFDPMLTMKTLFHRAREFAM